MAKIVISYRRSDSDAIAGRIRDRLATHFGKDSLFMDIDNIPFGTDFREHIKQELRNSDLMVVVIGPKWLGPARGGRTRIKEESDPVRIEVETALQNGLSVVPLLVGGARMPSPADLPESLKDFAFRNAAEVETGRDFHPHMDRLIRSLDRVLGDKSAVRAASATPSTAQASERPATPPSPLADAVPAAPPVPAGPSIPVPARNGGRRLLAIGAALVLLAGGAAWFALAYWRDWLSGSAWPPQVSERIDCTSAGARVSPDWNLHYPRETPLVQNAMRPLVCGNGRQGFLYTRQDIAGRYFVTTEAYVQSTELHATPCSAVAAYCSKR